MKKKVISLLLSLVFVLSTFAVVFEATSVSAVSKRTKAARLYKKYLEKVEKKNEVFKTTSGKKVKAKFTLAFLDKDNVPELLIKKGSNYSAYTIKKGKVKKTEIQDLYSLNEKFKYISKGGVYARYSSTRGNVILGFYKIKGRKTAYKISKVSIITTSENDSDTETKYFKAKGEASEEVTKEVYKETYNKLTGGRKFKTAKFHPNSEAGRKKYCK